MSKKIVYRKKVKWGWVIFWAIVCFPIALVPILTAKTVAEEE